MPHVNSCDVYHYHSHSHRGRKPPLSGLRGHVQISGSQSEISFFLLAVQVFSVGVWPPGHISYIYMSESLINPHHATNYKLRSDKKFLGIAL